MHNKTLRALDELMVKKSEGDEVGGSLVEDKGLFRVEDDFISDLLILRARCHIIKPPKVPHRP